ncbi:ribonuclease domain-containing protein [Rhodococcus sp. TAF43]|uniref:ribonuclease domain-containing protein n=1 Tax=unclassified Rhodococcus (in: high G+C Gram-positive bacteria) TaxID=192944 RepID=UPI00158328E1|nr:ribonuclease domain-containing protein [Rhodococcus sp. W8901]QKT12635.1 ribonuclease [Rhodococcus sp. W8901]
MASPKSKNSLLALLVAIVGLAVAIVLGTQSGGDDTAPAAASVTSVTSGVAASGTKTTPTTSTRTTTSPTATTSPAKKAANSAVPEYVWTTLAAIDAGSWPPADAPGTQGGRVFGNHEGRLPGKSDSGQKVRYQEWDVNRKQSGRGRDAERIITGDDGSAWYTSDHYETFVRMR